MSKGTTVITIDGRNDAPETKPPQGIKSRFSHELDGYLLKTVTISGDIPSTASSQGLAEVSVKIKKLCEIKLSPSVQQYFELQSLVESQITSSSASQLLETLHNWCAENSVPFSCNISSTDRLAKIASWVRRSEFAEDELEAILTWCPFEQWPELPLYLVVDIAPALLPQLPELSKYVPARLDYETAKKLDAIINDFDDYNGSELVEGLSTTGSAWSLDLLCCVVANINRHISEWPPSAFEHLLVIAQLPAFEKYDAILNQAVRCLQPDSPPLTESNKVLLLEAICKTGGAEHVFRHVDLQYQNTFGSILCSVLDDADRSVDEQSAAPLSYLKEIPATLVSEALKSKNVDWVGFNDSEKSLWPALSQESKTLVLQELQSNPLLILQSRVDEKIPKELSNLLSTDKVMAELLKDPRGLSFYADRLGCLTSLPDALAKSLIAGGFLGAVEKNVSSFSMKPSAKADILAVMLDRGDISLVLDQIHSLNEETLRRLAGLGHPLRDFKSDCKIFLVEIYEDYQRTYHSDGRAAARAYAQEAWEILGSLVAPGIIPDKYRQHRLYEPLRQYAYPNNLSESLDSDSLEFCRDRSDDFDLFEVPQESIQLKLSAQLKIVLRNGLQPETSVINRIENLVGEPLKIARRGGASSQGLQDHARKRVEAIRGEAIDSDLDSAMTDVLMQLHKGELKPSQVKQAAVAFHAAKHNNFPLYVERSIEQAEQAPNKEYAHLLELREFFTTGVVDSLNETISHLRESKPENYAKIRQIISLVFAEEVSLLDQEIRKYVTRDEGNRPVRPVSAFFSKTEASAGMRGVAGVCVAGDNPASETDTDNLWSMENYLQLVLRDDQTRRCVGGVLLHYYEEQGKRILTASLNPSSTLLYKVDEHMMLNELVKILGDFAEDNDIDIVAVSRQPEIRTNRTGGLFERALDERIRLVGERFRLNYPETFSHYPHYRQQELDVIWRRGAAPLSEQDPR